MDYRELRQPMADNRKRKKKIPVDVYRLRGASIDFFLVGGKGLEPLTVGV